MIFFTAMAMGVAAGMLRSAFCIAFVAVLIAAAFFAAMLGSEEPVSYTKLAMAVAGYNAGLLNLFLLLLARHSLRARSA